MDNSLKGLILAAGVVVTCMVIGMGFFITREARNTSNGGSNQLSKYSSRILDMEKEKYDGLIISGKEVVNIIKDSIDDNEYLSIEVTNKKGNTTFYNYSHIISGNKHSIVDTGTQDIKLIQKTPSNDYYINPTGKFEGAVIRDQNDTIICLQFVQV